MAYRIDQAGNRTTSALTTAEIALYTAWAATAFGVSFVAGITSQAILAAKLNAPQSFNNPVPQGTAQAVTLPRSTVMTGLGLITAKAINAGKAMAVQICQALQAMIASNPEDPIPVATVSAFAAEVLAAGYDPTADIASFTTLPDSAYVLNWSPGPLAVMIFGSWLVLQASDAEQLGMANP